MLRIVRAFSAGSSVLTVVVRVATQFTPSGDMRTNSGSTVVLFDGTMRLSRARAPNTSGPLDVQRDTEAVEHLVEEPLDVVTVLETAAQDRVDQAEVPALPEREVTGH